MDRALFKLLLLQAAGQLRRMLRGTRTVRGVIFLVFGLIIVVMWLAPSIALASAQRTDPAQVRRFAPIALLAFCLLTLVTTSGERAVAFTPAEVDFLFPGPFSRRQLLSFKLLKSALIASLTSIIFSLVLLRYGAHWLACYFGAILTLLFVQLFNMAIIMIAQSLGARAHNRWRQAAAGLIVAAIAIAVMIALARGAASDPEALLDHFRASRAGSIILWPFAVFASTIAAPKLYPDFVKWGAIALAIDALLAGLVIKLDADFLESSLATSQKIYARIQRLRRGGLTALSTRSTGRSRIPSLPYFGGAGPIAWRQLVNTTRNSRALMIVLLVAVVIALPAVWGARSSHKMHRGHSIARTAQRAGPARAAVTVRGDDGAEITLIVIAAWVTMMLANILKFDFRSELDHIEVLKSLPMRPAAIATGEMFAPVAVMCALQWIAIAILAAMGIVAVKIALVLALFALPFNILMFGLENVLFLLFPSRVNALSIGDLQLFGRQVIIFIGKLIVLAIAIVIAGSIGAIAGGLMRSQAVEYAVIWLLLAAEALAMLPFVAWAYRRYDPSADTPV